MDDKSGMTISVRVVCGAHRMRWCKKKKVERESQVGPTLGPYLLDRTYSKRNLRWGQKRRRPRGVWLGSAGPDGLVGPGNASTREHYL